MGVFWGGGTGQDRLKHLTDPFTLNPKEIFLNGGVPEVGHVVLRELELHVPGQRLHYLKQNKLLFLFRGFPRPIDQKNPE